jgi:ribosomal protein S18 acetylase RimI-like enzyme
MTIRTVIAADWPRVGQLAELLVRTHHGFDRARFVDPSVLRGDRYTALVRAEVDGGKAMVRVAEVDGRVVGYVFASVEPENWKELRHAAGYIHDLAVDEGHRRAGIARALVASAIEWFAARAVRQVILWSAQSNVDAQRLFLDVGFRPTMIEMTLDCG